MYKYQFDYIPDSVLGLVGINEMASSGGGWNVNKTPFKDSIIIRMLEELNFPTYAYGDIEEITSLFGNPMGMVLSLTLTITTGRPIDEVQVHKLIEGAETNEHTYYDNVSVGVDLGTAGDN